MSARARRPAQETSNPTPTQGHRSPHSRAGLRILAALCLGLGLLAQAPAGAQEDYAGTAAHLQIGMGARALAMGGAFVAVADDATALHYNPAGLATLQGLELTSFYSSEYGASSYGALGVAGPGLGAGVQWLGSPGIEARDPYANPTGSFDLALAAARLAYARRLGPVAAGLELTYVSESLASVTGNGLTGDVGVLAPLGPVRLGLAARNLWGTLGYTSGTSDPFDPVYVVGMAWQPGRLTLALDYELEGPVRLGAEFRVLPAFALRAGASSLEEEVTLSGGLGLALGGLRLDYAYLQPKVLPGTHRLSLGYRF
ncbi:UPF0164 family protein [Limnochorda pilosa]|uniref:PorV/PorQ family protein n=1 Tax=Limnochorda pilosa TaxID=1555112 RepID=A0A0K2SIW0_LIMPI|nr:UPF0164 family protein [Limnochorda pilosa]BAS27043.1 hypothetical protein LIP_1186 [Limnochorda pilosa]